MSLATDLQTVYDNLRSVLTDCNTALTGKGGAEAEALNGVAAAITALPSGSSELPTLDNPAADSDVVSGKEYIDQNGAKRTGTMSAEGDMFWDLVDGSITGEVNNDSITSIKNGAFWGCKGLTAVNTPAVESIGEYAFNSCTGLTELNFPVATSVGSYAFGACNNVVSVNMPNVKTLGKNAFINAYKIETLNLPEIESVQSGALRACSALTSVNLPKVTSVGDTAFYGCKALTVIDFPLLASIAAQGFTSCSALATLILRSETVCTLANTNAFNSTPFASGGSGGTVYVPAALVESYQTAANWSTLYAAGSCTFVAIEGSEYE